MRTRSQVYSEQVYNQIQTMQQAVNDVDAKKYGSLCHSFPIMILQNGLSQAVAFVWVKSNNDTDSSQARFLKHLSELTGEANETTEDFQIRINTLDLTNYQRITRQILAASVWYKRFAESILDVKSGQQDEQSEDANA